MTYNFPYFLTKLHGALLLCMAEKAHKIEIVILGF